MRRCNDSLAAAVRGPVTLITVGALFALNNFTPFSFRQTWPVILIVFGLLSLISRRSAVQPPQQPYQTPPPYGYQPQPGAPYGQPAAPPVPPQNPGQPPNTGGAV